MIGETGPGRNPGEVEGEEVVNASPINVEQGVSLEDLAPGAPVGAGKSKGDLRALSKGRVSSVGITGERNGLQTSNFLKPKPKAFVHGKATQAHPESSGRFKKPEISPAEKKRAKELNNAMAAIKALLDKFDIDYDPELKLVHSSREREFILKIKINNNLNVPLEFALEGFKNSILKDLDARMVKEGFKKTK